MTASIDRDGPSQVRAVRRFNRFYAQLIDALEGDLVPDLSTAEMHILYELAYHPNVTAKQLAAALSMDAGYLSRLLERMVRRRLITRTRSEEDARFQHLVLSKHGQATFKKIDQLANERVGAMLKQVAPSRRRKLMRGMNEITKAVESRGEATPPFVFRPPKSGDFGWIIYRHGTVIAEEFGWNEQFEHLVTDVIAEFIRNYNPNTDRCWIAEHDGEVVGSVFMVRDDDATAKLRLLYVEPHMRGYGIGAKLVDKVVREAKRLGYQKLALFTVEGLKSARKLYEAAGFRLVSEAPNHEFSSYKLENVGQCWELALTEHVEG